MNYIARDPGAGGGLAWCIGVRIDCLPMPDGMTAQCDFIRQLRCEVVGAGGDCACIIERVGAMPSDGKASISKFMRHVGGIEAACYMAGLATIQVTPHKWMLAVCGVLPKNKPERKRAIKELMARRYPALNVTLKTADALGLLTYIMEGGK